MRIDKQYRFETDEGSAVAGRSLPRPLAAAHLSLHVRPRLQGGMPGLLGDRGWLQRLRRPPGQPRRHAVGGLARAAGEAAGVQAADGVDVSRGRPRSAATSTPTSASVSPRSSSARAVPSTTSGARTPPQPSDSDASDSLAQTPEGPRWTLPITGTDVATYTRERPGMSAFALEDGVVYHTYSAYARGLDGLWGAYQWLDRAPQGTQREGLLVAASRRLRQAVTRSASSPSARWLFLASAAVTIAWCASMSAMGGMGMPGDWTMSMAWMRMPGQTWPGAAASFLGMWIVMMVAMMLPSLVPMLSRYRHAVARTGEARLGWLTAARGRRILRRVDRVRRGRLRRSGIALAAVDDAERGAGAHRSSRGRCRRRGRRRAPVHRVEGASPRMLQERTRARSHLAVRCRHCLATWPAPGRPLQPAALPA